MEDQGQKHYMCKYCNQSFSNGKRLGGHMRSHLALISASKKQSTEANAQEAINGEKVLDFDEEIVKESQQKQDVDQDYGANGYGLRENPKKSWRVSNSKRILNSIKECKQCGKGFHSLRALASHMRSHSLKTKDLIKKNVCRKCGKGFDSVKALYGHMRFHSTKRSRPSNESPSPPSSSEEEDDGNHKLANPVRKKRSCTRYKSPKHTGFSNYTSLTSFVSIPGNTGDEVEEGALCLMMLSRGMRSLDEDKMVISNQAEFDVSGSVYSRTMETSSVEFEVSVYGSMKFCEFENKHELDLNEEFVTEIGSGQADLSMMKCSSN